MITFETAISLTITLLVGYISIAVTIYGRNISEKDSNKLKSKKITLYITVFFLFFIIVVWLLHFLDNLTVIYAIQQYILFPLRQVVNVITPINGKYFLEAYFTYGYLVGLVILAFPVVITLISDFPSEEKKPIGPKVFSLICVLFFILISFTWLEYYLSFSTFNAFIEFSFVHFFIANTILNIIIVIVVVEIMTA